MTTYDGSRSDTNQLQKSMKVLQDFSLISDLRINENKSVIYCNQQHVVTISNFCNQHQWQIPVRNIEDNPHYLGVPIIRIDWQNKLKSLKNRLRKTLFMDLNLYQRVVSVNTYLYSTLFFFDQHDPIPEANIIDFEKFVKTEILKYLPKTLALNRINWHFPHRHGGMGLVDLKKQLLGRRGYFVYITTTKHEYGFLHDHPLTRIISHSVQALINTTVRNHYAFTCYSQYVKKFILAYQAVPCQLPIIRIPGTVTSDFISTYPYYMILHKSHHIWSNEITIEDCLSRGEFKQATKTRAIIVGKWQGPAPVDRMNFLTYWE